MVYYQGFSLPCKVKLWILNLALFYGLNGFPVRLPAWVSHPPRIGGIIPPFSCEQNITRDTILLLPTTTAPTRVPPVSTPPPPPPTRPEHLFSQHPCEEIRYFLKNLYNFLDALLTIQLISPTDYCRDNGDLRTDDVTLNLTCVFTQYTCTRYPKPPSWHVCSTRLKIKFPSRRNVLLKDLEFIWSNFFLYCVTDNEAASVSAAALNVLCMRETNSMGVTRNWNLLWWSEMLGRRRPLPVDRWAWLAIKGPVLAFCLTTAFSGQPYFRSKLAMHTIL